MTLYGKNEASDLTAKQKKILTAAMELELKARAKERGAARGHGRIP
jgi:hypothetical protein